jgi:hypothetical protein
MADLRLEPDELKKLIKIAKGRSLSFAYAPAAEEEHDLFAIHRKKAPDRLAKTARKETGGTKVAYGTFAVAGKLMSLTCLKPIPALDKRLRRYLRARKLSMEIALLDAEGQPIGE